MRTRSGCRSAHAALGWTVLGLSAAGAYGQAGPPPPPPPLVAPPAPAGNPVTQAKALLGQALFFDEQLSSTRITACATCHIPSFGGGDPRPLFDPQSSFNPGADGVFGTPDDVLGSPGVPQSAASGDYDPSADYGLGVQVTDRSAPSMINAAYSPTLFWDGRATGTFVDPVTGVTVLPAGAALESQAAAPPASSVEMAHEGADWTDIERRILGSRPLALASDLPPDLASFVQGRTYPQLFAEAFGNGQVTARRAIMAIATYQRTLFSDQTPFNAQLAGTPSLTAAEQRGLNVFGASGCAGCHAGNRLTDDRFHYIGVRPVNDDLGRFNVTGANADRGAFKTPSLLNADLRPSYFHNGRFATLEEVVDFYDRGGDFDAPNKAPAVQPLGLTPQQKADLLAFLRRPLTDPHVALETGPFARPTLSTESAHAPVQTDAAPGMTCVAAEPPLIGNPSFTSALGAEDFGAGTTATLAIAYDEPSPGGPPAGAVYTRTVALADGADFGFGSVSWPMPKAPNLVGRTMHARWYVDTADGPLAGPAFSFTVFGDAGCAGDLSTTNANPGGPRWGTPDGLADGADLSYFVENWLDAAPNIDLNSTNANPGDPGFGAPDGAVNGADLSFFVEAWLAGCP